MKLTQKESVALKIEGFTTVDVGRAAKILGEQEQELSKLFGLPNKQGLSYKKKKGCMIEVHTSGKVKLAEPATDKVILAEFKTDKAKGLV